MSSYDKNNVLLESLLTKPDSIQLFRGQKENEPRGIHFTPDEAWARNFGTIMMKMVLPAHAKVKLLTPEDTEQGIQKGISDEDVF